MGPDYVKTSWRCPKWWVYQKVSRSLQFCHQFLGTPARINSSNLNISENDDLVQMPFPCSTGGQSQLPAVFIFRGYFLHSRKNSGPKWCKPAMFPHGRMPGIPAEGLASKVPKTHGQFAPSRLRIPTIHFQVRCYVSFQKGTSSWIPQMTSQPPPKATNPELLFRSALRFLPCLTKNTVTSHDFQPKLIPKVFSMELQNATWHPSPI